MTEGEFGRTAWKVNTENEVATSVSLADIMAEQIQEKVNEEHDDDEIEVLLQNSLIYDNSADSNDCSRDFELARMLSAEPDCSGDLEYAEQLQRQIDREEELREKFQRSKEECGVAKAVLASDPYHYVRKDDESDDEEDDDDIREFATNLLYEKYSLEFPACGFVRTNDGVYVTKHDREISERKNFAKAIHNDFAGENIASGRLTDKVLNDLRTCSKVENRKQVRVRDKDDKATNASSVDAQTRLILLKWINTGEFDRIDGVIAMGKEAAVLHAISEPSSSRSAPSANSHGEPSSSLNESFGSENTRRTADDDDVQSEESAQCSLEPLNNDRGDKDCTGFAIKVFRTSLAGFRNRSEYVKDDFRFKNPRRVMKIWAEKEFLNLQRLRKNNIMCPTPIRLRKHVLLMSLIGKEKAAQKLKDVIFLDSQSKTDVFQQVRRVIIRMFKESKLVHGDLSEFNLLWHNNIVYVIDVAQAMDTSNSRALAFLLKDIVNILTFFGRIGTENLPSARELFTEVTDIEIDPEKNLFCEVENFERENRGSNLRYDKSRPADMEWRIYKSENMDRSVSPARPFN